MADAAYPYADFPAARFTRIGKTPTQVAALAAQWAALSPAQQDAQGRLIESSDDTTIVGIAAGFPAPLNANVVAVVGVNAPANPAVDTLWYNRNTDQWNRWSGTAWVVAGTGLSGNTSGTSANPVTDPAAARPTGLTVVYWLTATRPTNLAAGDVWESTA